MTVSRRHITTFRAAALPAAVAALAFAFAFAPAASAQTTGGMEAATSVLDVRPASLAQRTLRIAGEVGADAAGRTVRIERQQADGQWETVATAVADADGAFAARWVTDAPGRYVLRATVEHEPATAEAATAGELFARVSVFAPATASWYGPGFFGRQTACGTRLTRRTLGVAHRTLPCGTRVEVYHRNRTVVVPVIDRGPFVAGRQWDLTQAAAEAIGLRETSRVGILRAP
ncbi:MAG TPA: RlpA-like double-psi beta-barrel domain-containing protein [Solirubrobacteraceae bacterium]|jgi:rare lipoprotein A (peptidoglycan hydrolase)|nr:RlpA-like double-psi beta-barrel domain-containing protein [Solirubrobacteraceae bacterium]